MKITITEDMKAELVAGQRARNWIDRAKDKKLRERYARMSVSHDRNLRILVEEAIAQGEPTCTESHAHHAQREVARG